MEKFELPSKSAGADKRGLEQFGLAEGAWMLVAGGGLVSVFLILVIVGPPYPVTVPISMAPGFSSLVYAWFFFRSDRPPRFHQDWWSDRMSSCVEENPLRWRREMADRHPKLLVGKRPKNESFARRLFRW